jgi:hypothetical protein
MTQHVRMHLEGHLGRDPGALDQLLQGPPLRMVRRAR